MRLLTWNDLPNKGISYSRSQIYRLIRAGRFPEPVKLGENRIAFVESEIDNWIREKVVERDRRRQKSA